MIECIPNFSEGRRREVIDAIAAAIGATRGASVLDIHADADHNRSVITFAGAPDAVAEAAFQAVRQAAALIDMEQHRGQHPRVGATDVLPFVPLAGATLEECVALARAVGRRIGEELGIPVYLYEAAAREPHRTSLKQIRAGEYEGLAQKIRRPEWQPDFGPAELVPSWGATVTGARFFLIAYNVNVLGTKEQAHRIALDIREQGRGENEPGRLRKVKAIGWWVEEYGMAQVSINLDDYTVTPPHVAYEACVEEARKLRVGVAGSEIVGLVPLQALLVAAEHYIGKEGLFILDERQKIRLAVERLGLSSVAPFVPAKRIIEYMVAEKPDEPLASLSVRSFVENLGSRTPAPGGGSAAALMAAMGAALGAMVGWMTYGKRRFEDKDAAMRRLLPPLDEAMRDLIPLIDADTKAFNGYMAAMALPRDTPEQAARRDAALQDGLRAAASVPLRTMRVADRCWDHLLEMARHGNFASRSDLEVGAKALEAGVWSAGRNVHVNLPQIDDAAFRSEATAEAEALTARARERLADVLAALTARQGERP